MRSRKITKSNVPGPYNIPSIDDVPNFTLSNINSVTCNTFDFCTPNLDEDYLKGMVEEQDKMHGEGKGKGSEHQSVVSQKPPKMLLKLKRKMKKMRMTI